MNTEHQLADQAFGASVTLDNGQKLFDLATGGIGHSTKEIVDSVKAQAMKMGLSNRVLMSEPLLNLCHSISHKLPDVLSNVYVCSSGDEAFEGALKLCKALNPSAKTIAFISGCHYGSLFFGRYLNHHEEFETAKDFIELDLLELDGTQLRCSLEQSDDVLALCYSPLYEDDNGELKAFTDEQLTEFKALSKKMKVPLICNVSEYCMGVTGHMFGLDLSVMVPDFVVLGGPLGGNLVPVGCYITSLENANNVYGASSPAKHGSTTGGNPLASVAGTSTLEYVQNTQADKRFIELGQQIAGFLQPYVSSVVGSIVNLGLPSHIDARSLMTRLRDNGVLVRQPKGNTLTLHPILNSNADELTGALRVIKGILDDDQNT
ncbi:aminotransferase class III-fold pyridoxal phosphate-dependent enzyme [Vibrio ostreicida]|uniref:Aminotransferase class III-fold pyridoxal phosphate-dependent enzyme n=1 Tax=Vibrio ostreicida TaxID=526588 RepID=A0ABT8BPC6_9VIBR|nr:aminotransferase class III-fold pyridoxal phosphate-dependent enzyme [Vibrio ostreicida]MDN3608529.1 aminotransferase class III-fold pyridoxal phosphate-dependent enzyme [Vibrio ostreicida]NPD10662.1 aminotransferase class III-fold pyridoxal phosphate-dependent enzyme [Vibrio ostreicida]